MMGWKPKHGGIAEIIKSKQAPGIAFKGSGFTRQPKDKPKQKEVFATDDTFEKVKQVDPEARVIRV
jgi:predicted nucleic acid-binding Zn ribbon protein